ncbi:MAG: mechanosensitive ion channel family protein [Limisphaerales bacterium]
MLRGSDFTAWDGGIDGALTRLMEHLFGPGVHHEAFWGLRWEDIGVAAWVVVLILMADGLSSLFLRHKHKEADEKAGPNAILHTLLDALAGPLRMLIWVSGAYLSATLLLMKLSAGAAVERAAVLIDNAFCLGLFGALFWLFFRLTRVLEALLVAWAAKGKSKLDLVVAPLIARSFRVILPVVGIIFALPVIGLPQNWAGIVAKGSSILVIVAITWILFEGVKLGEQAVLTKYDIHVADNLQARRVFTQVHVIGKTMYVLIAVFAMASVLMLFEEVRRLGTTILASAGAAGIVLGIAAQHTLANLFAGIQVALTQPIRMDDVLVVEGEWGRVEEITLTYVVIHIWDDRRLVLPLSYFIEKPFQNWTRVSAQLLGSVFLWTDYTLPVAELRTAVGKIVESSALWDKRFWNLQVSDATEQTMQLRVLATAADSSKAWDLRCEIREKLIDYVQRHYPHSLPRRRVNVERPEELTGGIARSREAAQW